MICFHSKKYETLFKCQFCISHKYVGYLAKFAKIASSLVFKYINSVEHLYLRNAGVIGVITN